MTTNEVVARRRQRRRGDSLVRLAVVLAVCACLPGCASVADVAGALAGLASGAISANPAVGIGVGIATRAAVTEAEQRVAFVRRRNEQDAIAAAIAEAGVGETRPWSVQHRVTGEVAGEVRVIRVIDSALAVCKEAVFSVASDEPAGTLWFSTTACDEGGRWRWAAAEPAVERWGNLQ